MAIGVAAIIQELVPMFSVQSFKQELLRTIIAANLSFRIVEHPQFCHLVNMLRSNVVVPSAATLKHAVHEEAINTHLEIQRAIPQNVQVYLATDTWTSINGLAFVGTTIHYIDNN